MGLPEPTHIFCLPYTMLVCWFCCCYGCFNLLHFQYWKAVNFLAREPLPESSSFTAWKAEALRDYVTCSESPRAGTRSLVSWLPPQILSITLRHVLEDHSADFFSFRLLPLLGAPSFHEAGVQCPPGVVTPTQDPPPRLCMPVISFSPLITTPLAQANPRQVQGPSSLRNFINSRVDVKAHLM